ncbi:MAG: hypothetical protein AB7I19_03770 [Planctomycetota bacterium]
MLRISIAFALLASPSILQAQAAADKVDLRVLYVGSESSRRAADFIDFLGAHFEVVGTANYPDFKSSDADAFDVVVLDAEMHPTERSIGIGPQPKLPADYSRATILVSGPGVIVADRQLHAKLDWL